MVIAFTRSARPEKRVPSLDLRAFQAIEKHLRARFDRAIFWAKVGAPQGTRRRLTRVTPTLAGLTRE